MNNEIVVKNIKQWLKKNGRSRGWLAKKIKVSVSLVSQMLNGERKIPNQYLLSIVEVTGMSPDVLAKDESRPTTDKPICKIRGGFSNPKHKRNFDKLLWDIQCYVDLEAVDHE